MFCNKCGAQLNDDERYCYQCGASVAGQNQDTVSVNKQKQLWPFILIIAVVLLVLVGLLIYNFASGSTEKKYNDQLELAERYLDELDYDRAIAAYKEAIEIDPRQAEAYLGLANAYEESGDIEEAIRILEDGYAQTGERKLEKQIKRLKEKEEAALAENNDEKKDTDVREETMPIEHVDTSVPIESDEYKKAYKEFLTKLDSDYQHDLMYTEIYITDDNIPELVVYDPKAVYWWGDKFFTYKDNKILYLGSIGNYGCFGYTEYGNMISFDYAHSGAYMRFFMWIEDDRSVFHEYEAYNYDIRQNMSFHYSSYFQTIGEPLLSSFDGGFQVESPIINESSRTNEEIQESVFESAWEKETGSADEEIAIWMSPKDFRYVKDGYYQ